MVEGDFGRDELLSAVAFADVLWVRLRNQIDEEVLAAAVRLKAIVTNTTGLTHIDVDAARRRGVHVISLRGEAAFLKTVRATAELTLGLVLPWSAFAGGGQRTSGMAAGTGMGSRDTTSTRRRPASSASVGWAASSRPTSEALGMSVLATTPENESAAGVSLVSLDELLARADLVSVHVDLNPGTRELFGRREFATMKTGAWFVNTSRGEVVDEQALLVALESGRLQGAALDVLAGEPTSITPSHPLVRYAATHDNLIITPHIGGYTFESLDRTECHLAGVLLRLSGSPAPGTGERQPRHRAPTPTEV